MCMPFYKNKLLNGISGYYGKNIDIFIKEIHENSCGGGFTYLNECSLSETQLTYQDIIIDGNTTKEVTEVKFPLKIVDFYKENNNYKVLGTFNVSIEGGSFISNNYLSEYLPEIMKLLKCCTFIDLNTKHTKFDSLIYRLVHKCVT